MIEIKKDLQDFIKPLTIYDPNGKCIGVVTNIAQFADLRLQICEACVKGYKCYVDDEFFAHITEQGALDGGNYDDFDVAFNIIAKMLYLRQKQISDSKNSEQ